MNRPRMFLWRLIAATACWLNSPWLHAAEPQAFDCLTRCTGCAYGLGSVDKAEPSAKYRYWANCHSLQVRDGELDMLYRHASRVQWATLSPSHTLQVILAKAPPGPCGLHDPQCLQRAQSERKVTAAGHGIDGREGKPQGVGQPCALGLPCGRVLPPQAGWTIRLTQADASGRLELFPIRTSTGATWRIRQDFSAGQIRFEQVPSFSAGVYGYEWMDANGRPLAQGEFSVLGTASSAMVNKQVQARIGGKNEDEAQAWLAELAESELFWDLGQRALGATP